MTGAQRAVAFGLLILTPAVQAFTPEQLQPFSVQPTPSALTTALDRLFDDGALARAHVAVRVESLGDGRLVYQHNSARLVVPASVLKLITVAVAADRLGWNYRFETRLDAVGTVTNGTLAGDLVVVGSGDPSITSADAGHAPLFLEWAVALRQAGITRVEGRLIGDDNAFDDERLGAGWAWDYLAAGYAAPVGALNFNENVAVVHIEPGADERSPAVVRLTPPGHLMRPMNEITTGPVNSPAVVSLARFPGESSLYLRGTVPFRGPALLRTAAVDNPTSTFVEALRLALADRGIRVRDGAWDIDDLPAGPSAGDRTTIAKRESQPLSSLAAHALKVSQNLYGEVLFKTIGRGTGQEGSAERGRQVVRNTLLAWGVPPEAVVMYDGSGLSRYNFVTADALGVVLNRVWNDARLRGPFLAALPVAGHDGTLESRMRSGGLDRHVQAKTGTIANVRSLAGYLETRAGEKLAFTIIANNFTAPAAEIDAVAERALELLLDAGP